MGLFDSLKSYKAGYDAAQALIDKDRLWGLYPRGKYPWCKEGLKAVAYPEAGFILSSSCPNPAVILKLLLDAGVDPNSYLVDCYRNPKYLKLLLDAGADPNYTNPVVELPSPLNLAISDYFNVALNGNDIKSRCFESIKLLLKAGADPNSRGYNGMPLEVAVSAGDKKLIKLLLDAGAKS